MGTTRDALINDSGVRVTAVVLIEGYGYALTDGAVAAVFAALDSSAAPFNAYTRVLGGLSVKWDVNQRAAPWKALDDEPPSLAFTVAPDLFNEDGSTEEDPVDTFGVDVFKRSGGTETQLAAAGSLAPDTASVVVRSSAAFDATGVIYIGPEAIGYDDNDGATTFSDLTRAKWTPFATSDGTGFARSHRSVNLSSATGDPIGVKAPPLVSDEPNKWIGRWVAAYLLRDSGGTLDVLEQGHRVFCGRIANTGQDGNGCTVIECNEVRRVIYETQILRDQYRATLQEGFALTTGQYFQCRHVRTIGAATTIGDANVLTVVASGASGANQIDAGIYTAVEIGEAITNWMRAEKTASRLIFNSDYDGAFASAAGRFSGRLHYSDPTLVADRRRCVLIVPDEQLSKFLGWGGALSIVVDDTDRDSFVNSPDVPLRISLLGISTGGGTWELANPSGTWVDQSGSLPPDLQRPDGTVQGIFKIGELGYVAAARVADDEFTFPFQSVLAFFPNVPTQDGLGVPLDSDIALDVTQVIVMEGTLASLLPALLLSTGTAAYNSADDTLPESLGCAIPYSIFTDDFATDLANVPAADRTICMVVDKPTRLVDLMNADALSLWSCFVYREGRLSWRTWSTPTSGALGAVTVNEDSKGVPAEQAQGDRQRRSSVESFETMQNVIKIEYARAPSGELVSDITLEDGDSIGAHGTRGFKIELRNTAGRTAVGDVLGRLEAFSAALPMFTKPSQIVVGTMGRQMFEQLPPLTPVLLTDSHIRAPDTGLRGITGWPGIVVANRHDWGGVVHGVDAKPTRRDAGGEVEIMIFDRVAHSLYCPTAEVDDTADAAPFSSGYDAATFKLRCYANKHSTTGHDAAEFPALSKVRIVEISPPTAATPLSWQRVVASQSGDDITLTAALTSPSWDPTKFYRVVSDDYAAATATQQTKTYQADDADGLVADLRGPYGLVYSGAGQSATFTGSSPTEVAELHSTSQYGDGVPLHTGAARMIARNLNNLVEYKTAPQGATTTREEWVYGGAGAKELIACIPVFVGVGLLNAGVTILASVAPIFKSIDGADAIITYTLARNWPQGDTRDDVALVDPYVQVTFTRAATTYAVPTPKTLDTRHIARAPGQFGGVGWLWIEINSKVSMRGPYAHWRVGPRSVV